MTDKPPAMPELPEPVANVSASNPISGIGFVKPDKPYYTADQMRAYALAALQSAQPAEVSDESAYNLIDRFLRNNLHDDDYAEYSQALDILALRPQAVPMTDEPFLKVHKGEICYKSDADDQSYGMWCPVNWDTEHGFSDGTVFYAHHGITQRADGGEKQA